MVTVREDGRERRITAAEAFLLQLTQKGLSGDSAAARASLTAIEAARTKQGDHMPISVIRLVLIGMGIETILADLGLAVKKHALNKDRARWELQPWIPGVAPAKVAILGGGVSGLNAAQMAVGLRADVTIYDISNERLAELDTYFGNSIKTAYASNAAIAEALAEAHLVIGAVLVPGAAAPKLVKRDMLATMKRGAVLVDIAIDQGGCFETSHATTHDDPVYEVDGIIHYCVANMPGAVARTSAIALNNATLKYALKIANLGLDEAMKQDRHLRAGLNVEDGVIRHPAVAEALGMPLG